MFYTPNYTKNKFQIEDQQKASDKTHKANLARARMKDRARAHQEKAKITHLYKTKQITADKANQMWDTLKKQYRHVL